MVCDAVEQLAGEVERLVGRLRALSPSRLGQPGDPRREHPTRADAGRCLAQVLADAALAVEGRAARPLPQIPDHAVADQVAVTGHDLVAALRRTPVPALAAEALAAVVRYRHAIDPPAGRRRP